MKSSLIILMILWSAWATQAANLIPNSSFELGASRGWIAWDRQDYSGSPYQLKHRVVKTNAVDGSFATEIHHSEHLLSRPFFLTNGEPIRITLSAMRTAGALGLRHRVQSAISFNGTSTETHTLGTSYARFTNSYTSSAAGWYQISFWHFDTNTTALLDCVQVERGTTASAWQPNGSVELGLGTTNHFNTIFDGESAHVNLMWWNSTASPVTKSAHYQIYDVHNRNLSSGFVTANLEANGKITNMVSLPKKGHHRIVTRIIDTADSYDELTAVVYPFPRFTESSQTYRLGVHANYDIGEINLLVQSGFVLHRVYSVDKSLGWNKVEATEGVFVWNDDAIDIYATNGFLNLAVLSPTGHGEHPAWATNSMTHAIDLEAMSNYVYQVANRYSSELIWFEAENEPFQSSQGPWLANSNNYAAALRMIAGAVAAANPSAFTVGFGGSVSGTPGAEINWINTVWAEQTSAEKARVHAVSTHIYPTEAGQNPNIARSETRFAIWNTNWNGVRPIWMTESGIWERGAYFGQNGIYAFKTEASYSPEGLRNEEMNRFVWGARDIAFNLIRTLGHPGFTNYWYYDARSPSENMHSMTHSTLWEFQDTMRPKGTALAIANWILGKYTSSINLTNSGSLATVEMYRFTRGTTNVIATFSNDRLTRDLSVTNQSFVVYDMMGNLVTQESGKLRITGFPSYVVSSTLSTAQLVATLQNPTSTTTIADTNGPNTSFSIMPSGEWPGTGLALMKWESLDERYSNFGTNDHSTNILWSIDIDGGGFDAFSATNFTRRALGAGNHTITIIAKDKDNNTNISQYVFAPTIPSDPIVIRNNTRIRATRGIGFR